MIVVSSRVVRSVLILTWVLTFVSVAATASQAPRTTKARVYSQAQAARGESLYMSLCVTCHPTEVYKGNVFLTWQGKTLGELMAFLQDKMPKNDPGSMTAEEYADVIAYLLKLNAMPAGTAPLSHDAKVLRGITIDIKGPSAPASPQPQTGQHPRGNQRP